MNEKQIAAMRQALEFVVALHPAFICEAINHTKAQRHSPLEPCPHIETQQQVAAALTAVLADHALDKMAENAREIGLDYEPEKWEHLKAYGYAPGGYMMTCRGCNTTVIDVDKRASRCKSCATKAALKQPTEVIDPDSRTISVYEQPAQEVDWEKLYRLEVKKKGALAAKYERDTGKQLTRIVPMNQPAQQEPKQSEIFCGVDFADGMLSVSVLRRREDDVAELLHSEQIALPAQQEPVAWVRNLTDPQPHCVTALRYMSVADTYAGVQYTPLYPRPQAREWVGLTDEEIAKAEKAIWDFYCAEERESEAFLRFYRAIEAKLREKNA